MPLRHNNLPSSFPRALVSIQFAAVEVQFLTVKQTSGPVHSMLIGVAGSSQLAKSPQLKPLSSSGIMAQSFHALRTSGEGSGQSSCDDISASISIASGGLITGSLWGASDRNIIMYGICSSTQRKIKFPCRFKQQGNLMVSMRILILTYIIFVSPHPPH